MPNKDGNDSPIDIEMNVASTLVKCQDQNQIPSWLANWVASRRVGRNTMDAQANAASVRRSPVGAPVCFDDKNLLGVQYVAIKPTDLKWQTWNRASENMPDRMP